MKIISNTKTEENLYELKIRVEGEEFADAFEKSFAKNSKKLNIPGFRKGKAPKAMILKMVGEEYFLDDAINATYQKAYTDALDEAKLEPVDRADVEIEEATKEGYTFVAKVTVKPEVVVKDYKGLKATRTIVNVTDKDVEEELARMADQNSRMVDVTDRAAALGDTANIDFEGFCDGVAFEGGKGTEYDLVLGSNQFIPGFEDQIVGKEIGSEFDVNVKFPEEYHAEDLKGKDATFKVKLHSLKFKEMPVIDDEFAKDVSEFDTLDQLKADMLEKMKEHKQFHADQDMEDELCEAAAANMEANIPEAMFERKIDDMVQDFSYRLQSQGMKLEDYLMYTGMDMKTFRKGFTEEAKKQVKISLTLEAIAKAENLTPSNEAIAKEYENAAKMYNIDVEKVKTFIKEEDIIDSLKLTMAIDLIKENAEIKEKKETAAKKASVKKTTKAKEEAEGEEKKPAKKTAAKKTTKKAEAKEEPEA